MQASLYRNASFSYSGWECESCYRIGNFSSCNIIVLGLYSFSACQRLVISGMSLSAPIKVEVGWPDARPVFPTVSLSDAEFAELNVIDIDIEVLVSNVGRLS